MRLALLHPGEMGVTVGVAAQNSGHSVVWSSAGRSDATAERARAAGFISCSALSDLLAQCDGVISICPPNAAMAVAQSVVAVGFDGLYVDANAVAPHTARRLHELLGDRYVDGGIVGPPALRHGSTRLYLSGSQAAAAAGWFGGGMLEAITIDGGPGAASALKMCYAAYTKGTSALLLAIRALAEAEGITGPLIDEWATSQKGLADRSANAAIGTAPKAWRFVGEMEEIAATFSAAGLPGGFHGAAAEIYRRMADLRNV
ncbi:MAG: DUF1932 domain-containing protein, partial [Gammaproteobacteria bacterium]|nr:DUF1932 domain-containing protein [Gammaproteobacteria bacterium]